MSTSPKFESFNWLRAVADDTRITIIHRLVLMRLCLHRRNDTGRCDPGYDIVAHELGVHRATVFRAIDVGVRLGYLAQPIRRGPAKADLKLTSPNEVAPELPLEVAAVRPLSANEVAPVQQRGRTAAQMRSQRQRASSTKSKTSARNGRLNGRREREKEKTPARCARDTHKAPDFNFVGDEEAAARAKTSASSAHSARRPRKNEADGAGAAADDAAFERWWSVYPKQVGIDGARKAWARVIKNAEDAERAFEAAKRYAIERRGEPARYTFKPENWLKAGHWKDPPPDGLVIDGETGEPVAVEQPQPQHRQYRDPSAERWALAAQLKRELCGPQETTEVDNDYLQ